MLGFGVKFAPNESNIAGPNALRRLGSCKRSVVTPLAWLAPIMTRRAPH